MSDIVEFLLKRIAEDEAVARAAIVGDLDRLPFVEHRGGRVYIGGGPRVLAECEAKRRIVEIHQDWPVLIQTEPTLEPADPEGLNAMRFRMSQQVAWMTNREYVNRFGTEPPTTPILLALAQPYADHADFDPAWRI